MDPRCALLPFSRRRLCFDDFLAFGFRTSLSKVLSFARVNATIREPTENSSFTQLRSFEFAAPKYYDFGTKTGEKGEQEEAEYAEAYFSSEKPRGACRPKTIFCFFPLFVFLVQNGSKLWAL